MEYVELCPVCNRQMQTIKFYEHGFKRGHFCNSKDCLNKSKVWYDSLGRLTTPHETWVKRHYRKESIMNALDNKYNPNVSLKKLQEELKMLGREYD